MRTSLLLATLFLSACATVGPRDPHRTLEAVTDPQVLAWVRPHNERTWKELSSHPLFPQLESEVRTIATSQDRIAWPSLVDGEMWNFWVDGEHPRGILRVTSQSEYAKKNPRWRTVLDVDALNRLEGKSWVYRGSPRLHSDYRWGLMSLSEGGSDRAEVREFDFREGRFVEGGFHLPPAKQYVSWLDRDTIFVATDFGAGTLTASGYPRQVRLWKRGTPLSSAKLVFEGDLADMSIGAYHIARPEGAVSIVTRRKSFYEEENFVWNNVTGQLTKLPFPASAEFIGFFQGHFLAKLRKLWKIDDRTLAAGTLVSLPAAASSPDRVEAVWSPSESSTLENLSFTRSHVVLQLLDNVQGVIQVASRANGRWQRRTLPFPENGFANAVDTDVRTDVVLFGFQSFTTPHGLYKVDLTEKPKPLRALKSMPAQFDATDVRAEQRWAVSKDGTRIPYFVIAKKGIKLDGKNPTLLYGYGGFETSLTPRYMSYAGKSWLSRGGVYAIANIRGGGEFGPRWHEAALKENRQRAYDDFIAVSEALISNGVTSPRHLGIQGGSNGGLLVGVAFTQRPDLYRAVICEAALLDMLRYHKLPPGASWVAEYGDPEVREEAAYIAKYSPYQNLRIDATYPRVYFYTSTGDDRVQPGHTRKMVARMEEMGHDVLFYENIEGGHGGTADIEQTIKKVAMQYAYLFERLK